MIIRPIIFTPNIARWSALLAAFGATLKGDAPWRIAELAHGRVALHTSDEPSTSFGLEVASVDDVSPLPWISPDLADHGHTLRAHHELMPEFLIDEVEGERTASGIVSAAPLILTSDVEAVASELERLGLTRRLTSESGGWADLTGDGVVGVHIGSTGMMLGFETDRLGELAECVRAAGFRANLVDESFAQTLRIENPDDPAQEAEIWVNAVQTDIYGYFRN